MNQPFKIMTEENLKDEGQKVILSNPVLVADKTRSGSVCEKCGKDVDEVFMCERCEMMICDKCSATYNQFTQIDYNCCKECGGQRFKF